MKTLLVTLEYKPFRGGVAEYYSALFDNWPDGEIYVLAPEADNASDQSGRVIRKKLISKKFSWLSSFRPIIKLYRDKKIEHIIVGHILPLGTVVWFLSFILRFRYSVVMHGMDYAYTKKSARKRFLAGKILKRAKNIILGNSYLEELVRKDFPKIYSKCTVVNPGINDELVFDKKYQTNENKKFKIFFVGRLVRRKGLDRLIEALNMSDENVELIIAGEGEDKVYLENLCGNDKINFIGPVDFKQKWRLFQECDVFAMTPRNIDGDFEGFGIVYLEAGLAGKPVIATDSGGVRDAVVDGQTGILLSSDSPDKIKEAIYKLRDNPDLRKKMGETARKRAIREFSWAGQIDKIHKKINK